VSLLALCTAMRPVYFVAVEADVISSSVICISTSIIFFLLFDAFD